MEAYLSLRTRGKGVGWGGVGAYYLFYLYDGRLCEVGADSRLGAYSNKYGSLILTLKFTERCK